MHDIAGQELMNGVANIVGGEGAADDDDHQPVGVEDIDMDWHGYWPGLPTFHRIRAAG